MRAAVRVLLVLVFAAVLLALAACHPSDTQPGSQPPAPVTAPGPTPPPLED